jgi:hypothetical protein
MASDGKWYSPELHPERVAAHAVPAAALRAPVGAAVGAHAPAPIIPPQPAASTSRMPGVPGGVWGEDQYRTHSDHHGAPTAAGPVPRSRHKLHVPVDSRGVFVSLASAVVVVATFLPWYAVLPPNPQAPTSIGELTLFDTGFGSWRWALPAAALLAVVVGVADALARPTRRGALAVFVALRVIVLVELALVIAAIAARTPHGVGLAAELPATVRWPAWGSLAAAVVGFGASLAAAPPNKR